MAAHLIIVGMVMIILWGEGGECGEREVASSLLLTPFYSPPPFLIVVLPLSSPSSLSFPHTSLLPSLLSSLPFPLLSLLALQLWMLGSTTLLTCNTSSTSPLLADTFSGQWSVYITCLAVCITCFVSLHNLFFWGRRWSVLFYFLCHKQTQ